MNMESTKHPFSSDRPIQTRADDILDRTSFSNALASAIRSWQGKDSLVIGIYGPWGSGKTSLKNMVLDELRTGNAGSPEIVEFNPWQWAGQDQVANAFFDEIGKALGRSPSESNTRAAAKWKVYGAGLHLTAHVASGFRNLVFALLVVVATIGIGGQYLQDSNFAQLFSIIGYIALLLALLTKWSGTFVDKLTSLLDARAAANKKGLVEQKRELSDLLAKLEKPVLVVIDDIDRLSGDEIRMLFQLLKANADFPNVVYLLLFQLDIVHAALDRISSAPGQEFLKKIVQVGLDIPRLERTRLEKILFSGLDRILSNTNGLSATFDRARWTNIFVPGLRPYFSTMRDVLRFLGTLEFHVGIFRKDGTMEVNAVDLIAIEALRVFEPTVFEQLHDSKELLTSSTEREDRDSARKEVQGLVDFVPNERRQQVKEILTELFPNAGWALGGSHYGSEWQERWFRDLRVCNRDLFDRYFYLSIPVGDISQSEIEKILGTAGDRAALVQRLLDLSKRGLLSVAIDRLEAYKEQVALGNAIPFITALFDISDHLPNDSGGLSMLSPDLHLARIVYWYLKREPDKVKRFEILRTAMIESTGLYGPIVRTSMETRREDRSRDENDYLVAETSLRELQSICVQKIRSAAENGSLSGHAHLASILFRWREWTSDEEPRRWVSDLLEDRNGVLNLLEAFLQKSTSQTVGEYAVRIRWRIHLSQLETFVDISSLESKVAAIDKSGLSAQKAEAVVQFERAVRRRRNGKPDGGFLRDEED